MAKAQKKLETETVVKTEAASLVTKAQATALEGLPTVSAKIRYLDEQGLSRSDIAKTLNKRYQHVRNVLITPITKAKA